MKRKATDQICCDRHGDRGITENKIEKIFENFQQASSGTQAYIGGTGLGLAIVKQFGGSTRRNYSCRKHRLTKVCFSFTLAFPKNNAEAALDAVFSRMWTRK